MSLYAYINLQKTDYKPYNFDYKILPKNTDPQPLLDIYRSYAIHKNFESAWPVYAEEFSAPHNDIIGYYDQGKIVAWSMIYKVAKRTVWSMQFAWDYKKPELKLGYKSLRHECALYRDQGYETMLIDEDMKYKGELQGYEIFGPMK